MSPGAAADLVFRNGSVCTADTEFRVARAAAVKDGRILAVGDEKEVLATAGENTRVIDLRGGTLLPGLHDAHAHMDREGLKTLYPSLGGCRSIRDVLSRIEAEVKKARPGEWIVTMPLGDPPYYTDVPEIFEEKRLPDRHDLDRVSPANPVYIRGIWGYWNRPPIVSVANSMALRLAGIGRDTPPPYDGVTIERDASGEPTGVFREADFVPTLEFTLFRKVPRFTHELRVKGLRESMRRYNAAGITSVYEGHGIAPETMAAYRELHAGGGLTVRAHLVFSPTPGEPLVDDFARQSGAWPKAADGHGFGDAMLRANGVFLQYLGSRDIARLLAAEIPYTGWGSYYYAAPTLDEFRDAAFTAARHGIRVNTIAPFQRVVDDVLPVLEAVAREYPVRERRWVLSHVGPLRRGDIETIARIGLIATAIPAETVGKASHWTKTAEALRGTYAPYRSLVEAGIPFALATDNNPPNPFHILWCAIARRTRTGEILVPGERLTRRQALRAMTLDAARLGFEEHVKGSIEPGKHADLVVIAEDFLAMAEDDIRSIRPVMTVVGGRVVHESA